jgi:hypothetical protein
VVTDADQRPCAANINPEFLVQLSAQGLQNGFTGLHLAPRKLPQPAQMCPFRSSTQKNPAFGVTHYPHGNMRWPLRRGHGQER